MNKRPNQADTPADTQAAQACLQCIGGCGATDRSANGQLGAERLLAAVGSAAIFRHVVIVLGFPLVCLVLSAGWLAQMPDTHWLHDRFGASVEALPLFCAVACMLFIARIARYHTSNSRQFGSR